MAENKTKYMHMSLESNDSLVPRVTNTLNSAAEQIMMSQQKPRFNPKSASRCKAEFAGPKRQGPSQLPQAAPDLPDNRGPGSFSERGLLTW